VVDASLPHPASNKESNPKPRQPRPATPNHEITKGKISSILPQSTVKISQHPQ